MYPSDQQLHNIRYWQGTARELITELQDIWEFDPPEVSMGFNIMRKQVYKLEAHTWGWSGNEDIIVELRHTLFWIMCWQRSERGGHYYFQITKERMDNTDVKWGDPVKPSNKSEEVE